MLIKETIHLAKHIMEHIGSNSFTTPTSLQLTYNVHILLSIKEGMWFCRHTPHVTLGKATESASVKNHCSTRAQVQPHPRNQQILAKHFRYHSILVSVLREETTVYPFPAQLVVSSSINSQLLHSIFLSCSPTCCMNSLPGTIIWPTSTRQ